MNRRTILRWLGLAPVAAVALPTAAGAIRQAGPAGELVHMQFGCYQCGECLDVLQFELIELRRKPHPLYAVARCMNSRCAKYGVGYKIPLQWQIVETLPPKEA